MTYENESLVCKVKVIFQDKKFGLRILSDLLRSTWSSDLDPGTSVAHPHSDELGWILIPDWLATELVPSLSTFM